MSVTFLFAPSSGPISSSISLFPSPSKPQLSLPYYSSKILRPRNLCNVEIKLFQWQKDTSPLQLIGTRA